MYPLPSLDMLCAVAWMSDGLHVQVPEPDPVQSADRDGEHDGVS